MEPLKAIVIDDELISLQNLKQKLAEFCPDIDVVATAQRPEEAILLIRQHNPDVIFLDIEMPRMSGFRMLDELSDLRFEIIFTTAYNHYAVDAIRVKAFDYLMKPVGIKELQNAVERLIKHLAEKKGNRAEIPKVYHPAYKNQEEKISIPTNDGLEFIPVKTIVHIVSSSNYSKIFLNDGKSIFVTRLLGEFEDMLAPYNFFRVHNSHLINLSYIKKYIRGEGGQVIMQNGDVIDVSRRKKDDFLKVLSTR
ncbi:MAG TPA: LytTR family DNA-binding domain-containing protein [Chitinophagaceae bacterium]|nr:LytTR family DNA-binding domain-containing protein [Chitinophagaceae bacterium]